MASHQQHPVLMTTLGGNPLLPFTDLSVSKKCILDCGTGDGWWIRDMVMTLGLDDDYIGADSDPGTLFLKDKLPNQNYFMQHVPGRWDPNWSNSFDLVHYRLTLVKYHVINSMLKAVPTLAHMVKPGGWIQLEEAHHWSPPGNGPAMRQLFKLLNAMRTGIAPPPWAKLNPGDFEIMGREWLVDPTTAKILRKQVEEFGFVDVKEEVFATKIGARHHDKKLGEQGADSCIMLAKGVIDFCRAWPPELIPVSSADRDTLVERLRSELSEQGADYPLACVWGRKPVG